jgi:hypothetical protein
MGQMLKFEDWIQEPMEDGVLHPSQCWAILWEITARSDQEWEPLVYQINQRAALYHWQPGSADVAMAM